MTADLHAPNLHVSLTCPASRAPRLRERVEQKFFILPPREPVAFALLRRTCREDPEYAAGQVNSLYFDTPDLDQHQRSEAGEYGKDKVRIRWYGEEHDPHLTPGRPEGLPGDLPDDPPADLAGDPPGATGRTVRVWLELKSRRGFASTKQRLPLDVPASALSRDSMHAGIVPAGTLMQTMAGFGFFGGPLRPVIAISYRRHRFVEPQTGFRISLDSRIRSSLIMPGVGQGERGLELPGAIVEVKGPVFDIPRALRELAEIGSSWTRYSKYSSSLDAHASLRGSVSRLWPAGMMEPEPGLLARIDKTTETREVGTCGKN
jgi:hypothetical protein